MNPRRISVAAIWAIAALLISAAFFVRTVRSVWPDWRPKIEIHLTIPTVAASGTSHSEQAPLRTLAQAVQNDQGPREASPEPAAPADFVDNRPAKHAEYDTIYQSQVDRVRMIEMLEKRRNSAEYRARNSKGAKAREAEDEVVAVDAAIRGLESGKRPTTVPRLQFFPGSWGSIDTRAAGSEVTAFHVRAVSAGEISASPVWRQRNAHGPAISETVYRMRGQNATGLKEGAQFELHGMFRIFQDKDGTSFLERFDPWEKPDPSDGE